jgi:hypothetical protein
VVVTPPSAAASALKLGRNFTLPHSDGEEALLLHLATPWRALVGLPVQVPRSLKWARLKVVPHADGSATAEFDAEDESAEQAQETARTLEHSLRALNEVRLGLLGALLGQSERFVERIAFHPQGARISGTIVATARQVATLLDFAGLALEAWGGGGPRRSTPTASPLRLGGGGSGGDPTQPLN